MEKENMIAGIAVGDSDTYISVMQDGRVKNIPGLMDTESIPSAVAIKETRYLRFGYDAFGCTEEGTVRTSLHKLIREGKVVIGSSVPWSAEEVLTQFLKQQRIVLRRCAGNIDRAIFSIPWDFGYCQVQILKNAACRAGWQAVRLINETCLTALACYDKMMVDDGYHGFVIFNIKSDCLEAGYFEAEQGVLENLGVAGVSFQQAGESDTGLLTAKLKEVLELLRGMGAFEYTDGENPAIYNRYKEPGGTKLCCANKLFLTGEVRNRPELWEELKRFTGLEAQYIPFQYAARGAALQGGKLYGNQKAGDFLLLDATIYSYWLQVEKQPAECVIKQATTIPIRKGIEVEIQDTGYHGNSLRVQVFQILGNDLKNQSAVKSYIVPIENTGAFSKGTRWNFSIDIDENGESGFMLTVTDANWNKVFRG